MTALERAARSMAFGYLSAVLGLVFVLACVGHLVGNVPKLPARVERAYANAVVRTLDALLQPFDGLRPARPDVDGLTRNVGRGGG